MHTFNLFDHPICFTYPLRTAPSAWVQHVPFGMYLIDILRPRVVVELGTHYGVSYCAFCQAVKELKIDTRCYAIDTWQGDLHSGYYGHEVLEDLRAHHDSLYGSFSRLIQSTFEEALCHFDDHSIDLLHIDGFHSYGAVKRDFQNWLPKMSNQGVVIFHDINVRERNFGVWKLWEELKLEYQYFEIIHGHGLGLVFVGKRYPELLQELLKSSERYLTLIREFFYQLGLRIETAEVRTLRQIIKEQSKTIKHLRSLPKSTTIEIDPRIYDAYLGEYTIGPNQIVIIIKDGNTLMGGLVGQPNFALIPVTETWFLIEEIEAEVTFVKDEQGQVTHLILRLVNEEAQAKKIK